MKKVLIVCVLLIMPILIKAQKPQVFNFNKHHNTSGWNFGGGEVEVEDGVYTFTLDGSERDANIRKSYIKADNNKFVHIVMKCTSDVVDMLRLNFRRDDGSTAFVNLDMSNNDKEFKTYTFDLTENKDWNGVKLLSFRFSNNKDKATGLIEIDEIVLNNVATH